MTVCIQYSRPASGKTDSEIFGLDVAVTNLLTAYFRYGTPEKFICRPTDLPSFDHFKTLAQGNGIDAEARCVGLDPRHPEKNLGSIACIFRPDPLIADLTWARQQVDGRGYATCGLVHTMTGERIARAVGELCIAPTSGTDALICPSEAIRDAVNNLWEIYNDYLNHRFGSKYYCPIQTPVIPLGIDTTKFIALSSADKRSQQRQALNIADDEIVLLFTGRLSFATKAHPLALFKAANDAAKCVKNKVRLVLFGYFKPADMEQHFRALAAELCPNITVVFILNSDARFQEGFWAGADIFISLSDNIQESFGLTPVEAMACGLPSVTSDWNGYRGSIRDGIDGYLIPTNTPPPKAGMAIAAAYYNEQNYGVALMGAVQSTAVDIAKCTEALIALISDPEKRKKMGVSARNRAQDTFDWKHIIPAYEALWSELGQKRRATAHIPAVPVNWQAVHPAYPNPFKMFESFPSRVLNATDLIKIIMPATELTALIKHEMNYFIPELLLPKETMAELVEVVRRAGHARINDITGAFPPDYEDCLLRCIGWMLKHGVCIIEPAKL